MYLFVLPLYWVLFWIPVVRYIFILFYHFVLRCESVVILLGEATNFYWIMCGPHNGNAIWITLLKPFSLVCLSTDANHFLTLIGPMTVNVVRCAIWYHLYNLKNMKKTKGRNAPQMVNLVLHRSNIQFFASKVTFGELFQQGNSRK